VIISKSFDQSSKDFSRPSIHQTIVEEGNILENLPFLGTKREKCHPIARLTKVEIQLPINAKSIEKVIDNSNLQHVID
jgi:hypothetical protein